VAVLGHTVAHSLAESNLYTYNCTNMRCSTTSEAEDVCTRTNKALPHKTHKYKLQISHTSETGKP